MYKEIEGDLIELGKQGAFDVIGHGCNCFCTMKRGIAPQMADAFQCNEYPMENEYHRGSINKLGTIDYMDIYMKAGEISRRTLHSSDMLHLLNGGYKRLTVVNAYTQYDWVTERKPFDYEAFTLCARKMNRIFAEKHIGLPMIGSHLAGGDWERIKAIIQTEMRAVDVTIVKYNK